MPPPPPKKKPSERDFKILNLKVYARFLIYNVRSLFFALLY